MRPLGTPPHEYRIIFEKDEQRLIQVQSEWDRKTLLGQEGMFFLKDVSKALDFDPMILKKRAWAMAEAGQSPRKIMGMRIIFNHWLVRMTVFSKWYEQSVLYRVQRPPEGISPRDFLKCSGIFYLIDVSKILPVTPHQPGHKARKNPEEARESIGVWKDPGTDCYMVEMEKLSIWLKNMWEPLGIMPR